MVGPTQREGRAGAKEGHLVATRRKTSWSDEGLVAGIGCAVVLCNLAVWAAVIFVIYHFVTKAW